MVKFSAPVKILCETSIYHEGENLRIRIGTRPSPLALAQARIIADGIKTSWPDAEIITIPIRTSGDKNMSPFTTDPRGIKGLFTREIEKGLQLGEIDIAVHSLKDLPVSMSPDLPIVAYSRRGNPFDALITNESCGKVIGSSSLRRRLQIARLYPAMKVIPVRGNVGTRLKKLDEGEIDVLVLAACGLQRLGLTGRIARIFTADEIMPSAGQGIIACQGRAGEDYSYLSCVDDDISRDCATAERSFSRCIGAGCNIPAGAYAEIHGDMITLKGLYIDDAGNFLKGTVSGHRKDSETLGVRLAEMILG